MDIPFGIRMGCRILKNVYFLLTLLSDVCFLQKPFATTSAQILVSLSMGSALARTFSWAAPSRSCVRRALWRPTAHKPSLAFSRTATWFGIMRSRVVKVGSQLGACSPKKCFLPSLALPITVSSMDQCNSCITLAVATASLQSWLHSTWANTPRICGNKKKMRCNFFSKHLPHRLFQLLCSCFILPIQMWGECNRCHWMQWQSDKVK